MAKKPSLRKTPKTKRKAQMRAKHEFAKALRKWIVRRADRLATLSTSELGSSSLFIAAVVENDEQVALYEKAWQMFGQQVRQGEAITLIKAVYLQISPEVRAGLDLPEPDLLFGWLWGKGS